MTTPENTTAPDAAPKKVKQTAEEKAAAKAVKDKEKADAKAAKDAAKATPKVKSTKDTKNGVSRPMTGVTRQVWDMADSMSTKAPVERAPLVEALQGKIEVGTIHTQYGRWRKYYGLTETKEQRQARLQLKRDESAKKKAAEKEIKAAEKAKADAAKAEVKRVKAEQKAAAEKAAADAQSAQQANLTPEASAQAAA